MDLSTSTSSSATIPDQEAFPCAVARAILSVSLEPIIVFNAALQLVGATAAFFDQLGKYVPLGTHFHTLLPMHGEIRNPYEFFSSSTPRGTLCRINGTAYALRGTVATESDGPKALILQLNSHAVANVSISGVSVGSRGVAPPGSVASCDTEQFELEESALDELRPALAHTSLDHGVQPGSSSREGSTGTMVCERCGAPSMDAQEAAGRGFMPAVASADGKAQKETPKQVCSLLNVCLFQHSASSHHARSRACLETICWY
eukprot:3829095-Pleurochrysis_carterae.AAC.2